MRQRELGNAGFLGNHWTTEKRNRREAGVYLALYEGPSGVWCGSTGPDLGSRNSFAGDLPPHLEHQRSYTTASASDPLRPLRIQLIFVHMVLSSPPGCCAVRLMRLNTSPSTAAQTQTLWANGSMFYNHTLYCALDKKREGPRLATFPDLIFPSMISSVTTFAVPGALQIPYPSQS